MVPSQKKREKEGGKGGGEHEKRTIRNKRRHEAALPAALDSVSGAPKIGWYEVSRRNALIWLA
jgi:hypothetical protein